MKKGVCSILLFSIVALFLTWENASVHAAPTNYSGQNYKYKKHILVLNAYHHGYHWTDRIMDGVNAVFDEKDEVELYVNYMDTKRCSDSLYFELLKEMLLHKYCHIKFDAIIATDDLALDFMIQYRDEIFPDVPVSFCGINDFQTSRLDGVKDFTGVYESYDFKGTIELMKNLHPQIDTIAFVSDSTVSGQAFTARMKRIEDEYKGDIVIEYLTHMRPDDLSDRLWEMTDKTAILWSIYLRLPDKSVLTTRESIRLITMNTPNPVYCIWDVVGKGVVGGKITNPEFQGEQAAFIADRLAKGESADSIPIKGSPMCYKFDNNQLRKYKISDFLLPEGSIIINRSPSLFREYRKTIITVVLIVFGLIMVILILLYHIQKRKTAEHKLLMSYQVLKVSDEKLKKSNALLVVAKDKAEKSDQLKSAFLANLSHEIRTPMNGILGFASLLKEKDITQSMHEEYLEVIEKSGQRMLAIIKGLVDISKIEAGLVEVSNQSVNLNFLLQDVYELFQSVASQKGLDLKLEKGLSDSHSVILADRGKLEQICTNLIKNALKFTENGRVSFGYKQVDDELHFFVSDTGIGIKEESLNIVFDRFRKAERSVLVTQEGIGLGLAITKSFVEIMGGRIWIESKHNEGTTFFFTIAYKAVNQ